MKASLCVGEYCENAYNVEGLDIRVYSMEELCYCLKENAFLLDLSIMNDKLVDWIGEECKVRELAKQLYPMVHKQGSLSVFVVTILQYVGMYDPEEILIGGKLELTGVTEEAQPSFEEVTEYLPQAIIAQVGDSDVWEEKNLQIANWTCAGYVQDEKGRWPLEGNYEFTAELPDGYELPDTPIAVVKIEKDTAN